jgi:light-regulated signal transduction histidine kinase (bacteriophytochrome)
LKMGDFDPNRQQDEMERLRQALDRASAEFEEFVSMAAHNLRESLRDVALYSQLMAEAYAGRFDSDADLFLRYIQDGAARMQSLLTDVVDYWATGAGERPSSRTDMEAVLCQALLCTDKEIVERRAIVTHDPLPQVCGDFEILTKVLRHLIRNAIEFCDKPAPCVHISSKRGDLEWIFSVQDNGPGIDPAFQSRLFVAFKRLHEIEHPGNGLGLAFCKKVIEWQGGRMWMESTLGAGSTFYFTLPPAD